MNLRDLNKVYYISANKNNELNSKGDGEFIDDAYTSFNDAIEGLILLGQGHVEDLEILGGFEEGHFTVDKNSGEMHVFHKKYACCGTYTIRELTLQTKETK